MREDVFTLVKIAESRQRPFELHVIMISSQAIPFTAEARSINFCCHEKMWSTENTVGLTNPDLLRKTKISPLILTLSAHVLFDIILSVQFPFTIKIGSHFYCWSTCIRKYSEGKINIVLSDNFFVLNWFWQKYCMYYEKFK